jgi:hypothetical protein
MSSDDFNIKWDGLDKLIKTFDAMEESLKRNLISEYAKYGLLVEEGAKALAPHDTGDLEASITAEKVSFHGNSVETAVGSKSKYALRRHEEPYRKGHFPKHDNGSKFPDFYADGRGQITRSKPNWRGQVPGRKYLQNAINATDKDYHETNERVLKKTLGGGTL